MEFLVWFVVLLIGVPLIFAGALFAVGIAAFVIYLVGMILLIPFKLFSK